MGLRWKIQMDERTLNEYSRRAAQLLFTAYPAWRACARAKADAGSPEGGNALVIEIPSPARSERKLQICTCNQEVTVSFDRYHEHFTWDDASDAVDEAKTFIDALIDERTVVGVAMDGAKWLGSRTFSREELSAGLPPDITYVRSWRGTYDWDKSGA